MACLPLSGVDFLPCLSLLPGRYCEPVIITKILVAHLPVEIQMLPESRLNLVLNDIKNLVSGNIVSGEIKPEIEEAANHYRNLQATANACPDCCHSVSCPYWRTHSEAENNSCPEGKKPGGKSLYFFSDCLCVFCHFHNNRHRLISAFRSNPFFQDNPDNRFFIRPGLESANVHPRRPGRFFRGLRGRSCFCRHGNDFRDCHACCSPSGFDVCHLSL